MGRFWWATTMMEKIPHNKLSGFFILIFWWPRITCHIKSWDPTTKRLNEKNPSAYYGWWGSRGFLSNFLFFASISQLFQDYSYGWLAGNEEKKIRMRKQDPGPGN